LKFLKKRNPFPTRGDVQALLAWEFYGTDTMEGFSKDTEVWFQVNGYANITDYDKDDPLFEWGFYDWGSVPKPYVKKTGSR
jgi:hypothetical protein